MLVIGSKDKYT